MTNEDITGTGMTVGTPAYLSPEQAAGEQVDGRSDQYALACVLYEMLVGEPPFTGPNVQAVIAKRFVQTPADVTALREGVPRNVARAWQRAINRTPIDRFPSTTAFADALPSADAAAASTAVEPPERSIAVLPFVNLSTDRENEYLGDGIAEDIANALAGIPGLYVAARARPPLRSSTGPVSLGRSESICAWPLCSRGASGDRDHESGSPRSSSRQVMDTSSGQSATIASSWTSSQYRMRLPPQSPNGCSSPSPARRRHQPRARNRGVRVARARTRPHGPAWSRDPRGHQFARASAAAVSRRSGYPHGPRDRDDARAAREVHRSLTDDPLNPICSTIYVPVMGFVGRTTEAVIEGLRARARLMHSHRTMLRHGRSRGRVTPSADLCSRRTQWNASADTRGSCRS